MEKHPTLLKRLDFPYRLVELSDGRLAGLFVRLPEDSGGTAQLTAVTSTDGGRAWSEPLVCCPLDPREGAWGGIEAVVDHDGRLHVFLLNDRHSGVLAEPAGEENKAKMKALSRRWLDLWHLRSTRGLEGWSAPRRIWEGYTGSLNSVIQLRGGRIVLPFSYQVDAGWGNRGQTLEDYTFWGYFRSTVVFSDDAGESWSLSPTPLKVPVPDISYAYGAVEPVVVERADGRVWMLIRTQMGRFYESFSEDGASWSRPRPTELLSSDSPAGLVRLADGRLVLLWNCCLRYPYAYGGRHVLHAAISDADGGNWRGYREVYADPRNTQIPPPTGDHGTAYPYPLATRDGRVLFSTGQGKGRATIAAFHPAWLEETRQEDLFPEAVERWSLFATEGLALGPDPETPARQVLRITQPEGTGPFAAVRNFPLLSRGSVRLSLRLEKESRGVLAMLTDHFSVPFDEEDHLWANFVVRLGGEDGLPLPAEQWLEVTLRWDVEGERMCEAVYEGKVVGRAPLARATRGLCYLRLRCAEADPAGFAVRGVMVEG